MAIKAKKINQLPEGVPDKDSWIPFSDKNGNAFRMPAFTGGSNDFTASSRAVVARPKQTVAVVNLIGDMTGIGKDLPVNMVMKYSDENGTTFTKKVSIELQGNTSLLNPKKNYSLDLLNLFDDSEFKIQFGDWISIDAFHLKALYTDPLGVRNVGIARVAKIVWETRPIGQAYPWSIPFNKTNSLIDTMPTGARGVIDGFAIELIINGKSQGVYSWNLSKKRQNFNMDKGNNSHILASAEEKTAFPNSAPYFIPSLWDFKNPKFDSIPAEVSDAMTRLLTFICGSNQIDFNAHASEYLNVPLSIDYYILVLLFLMTDNREKNLLFASYDGLTFTPCLYDMDRTIGARHIAPTFSETVGADVFSDIYDPVWMESKLYAKLLTGFKNEFDERYAELRNKVLNLETLQPIFSDLANTIPYKLRETDVELWGQDAPHRIWSSVGQVMKYIVDRFEILDPQFNYPNKTALLI